MVNGVNGPVLTLDALLSEARAFAEQESSHDEPALYGVTDGKAVGTYLERKFTSHLMLKYTFPKGSSALGIDIPSLDVDIKTTSSKQPQSSSPFRFPRQKVYGLGYHLLVFVYSKFDDRERGTGRLDIQHSIFVDRSRTADYQMTRGIQELLDRDANVDDLVAFMLDRQLPVDDIAARNLAEEILDNPPMQGYLTISNALQWRLQYGRAIAQAGQVEGITQVR